METFEVVINYTGEMKYSREYLDQDEGNKESPFSFRSVVMTSTMVLDDELQSLKDSGILVDYRLNESVYLPGEAAKATLVFSDRDVALMFKLKHGHE